MSNKITAVSTLQEFTNEDITYGSYLVKFNGEFKVFIRNGNSVGVVVYYKNEPASKCVSEIRDDVREDLFAFLQK